LAPRPGGPTALEVHERIKLLVDYIKSIQEKWQVEPPNGAFDGEPAAAL